MTILPLVVLSLAAGLHCSASTVPTGSCGDTTQAPAVQTPAQSAGTVLMVLTGASEQTLADGSKRETGYFLNEFYEAYAALVDAGYRIQIATPSGAQAPVDPESLHLKYWEDDEAALQKALQFARQDPSMLRPISLDIAQAKLDTYQGLVVPGGQGVMVDLLRDKRLHDMLERMGKQKKPVGLICHAPALLTQIDASASGFRGLATTSVSGFEEFYIERVVMKAEAVDRGIGDQLEELGFDHDNAFPGKGFAVRDCNLVTSQNPFSGPHFSQAYLAALDDYRHNRACGCGAN